MGTACEACTENAHARRVTDLRRGPAPALSYFRTAGLIRAGTGCRDRDAGCIADYMILSKGKHDQYMEETARKHSVCDDDGVRVHHSFELSAELGPDGCRPGAGEGVLLPARTVRKGEA